MVMIQGLGNELGLWEARSRRRGLPAASQPRNEDAVAAIRQIFMRTSAHGYASCALTLARYDVRPAITASSLPLLLTCGSLDEEIPALRQR